MLAAVGWPISELYHYTLAKSFGMDDLLAPVRTQRYSFEHIFMYGRVSELQVY